MLFRSVAAGNSGLDTYEERHIDTPADANDILTIGSVDHNGQHSTFSSIGPTADGRIKPELCAIGRAAAYINPATGNTTTANGTSFATPIMAGVAACVWQAHPEWTAMKVRRQLIDNATQHTHPDTLCGYGITDAMKAAQQEPATLNTGSQHIVPYPNPTHDVIHLYSDGPTAPWQLTDTSGQSMMSGHTSHIDISPLPQGIYLLHINNKTHKIVKL